MCIGWIMNNDICASSDIAIKLLTVFCIVFKSIRLKDTDFNQLQVQKAWFLFQISNLRLGMCDYCNHLCILSAVEKADWQTFYFRWLKRAKNWNKSIHHFFMPYKHACKIPFTVLSLRHNTVYTFLERS